jgi:RND family efflux transporter MFP subunit
MKTLTLTLIAILSGLSYACTPSKGNEKSTLTTSATPVWIKKVHLEEVVSLIHTSGRFTTNDETTLSFKTGGIIDKIYVREGDVIRKGQLLATLNLTEINAQLAQAELALEKTSRDYERVAHLHKDSVASLEQFQNAQTALEIAKKQIETARFNRSYSEIRALANGYVLRKSASEGQMISSGGEVLQTKGNNENDWVLKAGVSDGDWSRIQLGDVASISIDAIHNQTFMAKVVQKSIAVDPASGSLAIELRLTGKIPTGMASGLFGKAIIELSTKQKVWSIPYDALLDGGPLTGFVFVTNDLKTVQKQLVNISAIEKDNVAIIGGLEKAQYIVIAGSAYLHDNSAITIIKQ